MKRKITDFVLEWVSCTIKDRFCSIKVVYYIRSLGSTITYDDITENYQTVELLNPNFLIVKKYDNYFVDVYLIEPFLCLCISSLGVL